MLPYPLTNEFEVLEPEIYPVFQVIEPTILSYAEAVEIRDYAESQSDPYYYEMAAMAFDILIMIPSAERMRARAEHYRITQEATS